MLTVLVIPVGIVVEDTVGLPYVVPVMLNVYFELTEFDIDAEPDTVDVFDTVEDAETVDVGFFVNDATIEEVIVVELDFVLEA